MTNRFILLEDSESGLDAHNADLFDDESVALAARDGANKDAEHFGIPVIYRLFELTEVAQ